MRLVVIAALVLAAGACVSASGTSLAEKEQECRLQRQRDGGGLGSGGKCATMQSTWAAADRNKGRNAELTDLESAGN